MEVRHGRRVDVADGLSVSLLEGEGSGVGVDGAAGADAADELHGGGVRFIIGEMCDVGRGGGTGKGFFEISGGLTGGLGLEE